MKDSSDIKNNIASPSGLKRHLVPVLLLLAAVFAVYAQSLGHGFLNDWDDQRYITENATVKGFTPAHLKAAFTSYYVGNYAPLHIVSYMLDYTLWGMRAAGFIFTNVLLHALNGLLYYVLLIKITGRRLWAFLASFIFLLHPVQVESVAWISQRKNVLAMFFFLVSFLLYIKSRDREAGVRSAEGETQNSKLKTQNLFYAGSVAAFVCSLLAKSVAVILPPVLLLYDFCCCGREGRKGWLANKVPFVAAAAVVAVVALNSQVLEHEGGRTGFHGGSPLATLFTMLTVLVRYLGMLFWPANLSAIYIPPVRTGIDGAVALSALLLALLAGGGVYLRRRRKDLFFWGALFFVGILPVSQIVPIVTLMNDRYLYFPMLGGAAFLAGAAVAGLDALPASSRRVAAALLCALLLNLPLLSLKRAEVWRNSVALWSDAAVKAPNSPLAFVSLGNALHRKGNNAAALAAYQRALALDPRHRDTMANMSNLYLEMGEFDKAHPYLLQMTEQFPDFAIGFRLLGDYFFKTGDLRNAEAAYHRSLALGPDSAMAFSSLGNIHVQQGNYDLARDFYRQAMEAGGETPLLRRQMELLEAAASGGGKP